MDAPAGKPPEIKSPTYASIVAQSSSSAPPISKPTPGSFKGEISGYFSPDLIASYARPFSRAVIGKFSKGRPSMKDIRTFLKAQDFAGPFSVGLINPRHILIRFDLDKDFHRCYSRSLWYVADQPMRVFKWTSDFHPNRESSIVPVWFNFHDLPIHFFNKEALFFLGSLFGVPLRTDMATNTLVRPSVARLQVEVDLQKPLPSRLWINLGDNMGFWQYFEPDGPLPVYCNHCWHLGHSDVNCNIKHPELKQSPNTGDHNKTQGNQKLIYRVVQKTHPENPSLRDNVTEEGKTEENVKNISKESAFVETGSAGYTFDPTLPNETLSGNNAAVVPTIDKGKAVLEVEDGQCYEEDISNRYQNRSEKEERAAKKGPTFAQPNGAGKEGQEGEKKIVNDVEVSFEEGDGVNIMEVNISNRKQNQLPQEERAEIDVSSNQPPNRFEKEAESGAKAIAGETSSNRLSNRFQSLSRSVREEGAAAVAFSNRPSNRFEKEGDPGASDTVKETLPNQPPNRFDSKRLTREAEVTVIEDTATRTPNRFETELVNEEEGEPEGSIRTHREADPLHSDDDVIPRYPTVQAIPPPSSSSEGERSKPKNLKKNHKSPVGRSSIKTRSSIPPKSQ